MERFIFERLDKWKNSTHRKPLILGGVRQVGKTWLLNGPVKTPISAGGTADCPTERQDNFPGSNRD